MDGVNAREFRGFIEGNGLADLDFVGPRFTWYNNYQGGARVWKRIDRIVARADWIQMPSRYQVHHLPRVASDHRPVLITTEISPSYLSPFRFKKLVWLPSILEYFP